MLVSEERTIFVNGVHQVAQGFVEYGIKEKGRIIKRFPPVKNLILNQGLNGLCTSRGWAESFSVPVAGTGTAPNYYDSGSGVTGSGVAGSSVGTFGCLSGFNFTTQSAVGDMLVMTSGDDNGKEVMIQSIIDSTTVTYTPNINLATGEFRVYRTSRTGLVNEVKRGYQLTGSGDAGTTRVGNVIEMKRTFEFSEESSPITYTEVGFSWESQDGNNLFSRIVLPTPVSLIKWQQLWVVYRLQVTLNPTSPVSKTFDITGWPLPPSTSLAGVEQIQRPAISVVSLSGGATYLPENEDAGPFLEPYVTDEPSYHLRIWLSPNGTSPATFPGHVDRSSGSVFNSVTLRPYTNNTFYRDFSALFRTSEANGTWRSMGFGSYNYPNVHPANTGQCFVCVFDEPQYKTSSYTLKIFFRRSVGRVLSP